MLKLGDLDGVFTTSFPIRLEEEGMPTYTGDYESIGDIPMRYREYTVIQIQIPQDISRCHIVVSSGAPIRYK